jgi:CRISPR-associated endonuclease/helicase Cas3
MAEFPSFETFFQAVHGGLSPFPWQKRLAEQVDRDGWPNEIGVPTGLGKTSCLDIAIWGLAKEADKLAKAVDKHERLKPTRIWYVVNRRLLVDNAYEHGKHLVKLITDPTQLQTSWPGSGSEHVTALEQVQQALSSITASNQRAPLHIVRLRGGAELGARPLEPSHPTMIFATVPMFASRWMFRGYGSSQRMRPIDAALAGMDSLVLLDEAHLSPALVALHSGLADCDPINLGKKRDSDNTTRSDSRDRIGVLPELRSSPRLVLISATGTGATTFDLDDDDLCHPVVKQRIYANKPVWLVKSSADKLTEHLVNEAISAMEDPARTSCLVFTNQPARAREVERRLREHIGEDPSRRVILLTGRMRDREADQVRKDLLDPVHGIPAGRELSGAAADKLWVVATQTLEVGADLDADVVVTESAGVRALIQRLGRCNRLGKSPSPAVVICHAKDLSQPLYGNEPELVFQRLIERREENPDLTLSPACISEVLGQPDDHVARPPEVLPWLVWEWVKTSSPSSSVAPVDAYFAPKDDHTLRVSVCWRAYRPGDDVALQVPIRASESVDIPIKEFRDFLQKRSITDVRCLGPDRASLVSCKAAELRPGDVVVLAPSDGGYDAFGWNPESTEEVLDVSLLTARKLPLCDEVANQLFKNDRESLEILREAVSEINNLDENDGGDEERDQEFATLWIDTLRSATHHPWISDDEWSSWCNRLPTKDERKKVAHPVNDVRWLTIPAGEAEAKPEVRADAFEQLNFDVTSTNLEEHLDLTTLEVHLDKVGEVAQSIAEKLDLPERVKKTVYLAAKFHDIGKHDRRFQLWLDPDRSATVPLAKSRVSNYNIEAARVAAGWPREGPHEAISARLVQAWIANHQSSDIEDIDTELLVHLVISHHGRGRPIVPVVEDREDNLVRAVINDISVEADGNLSVPDWGQPARFRRLCERYGYWGLALLEAVVRQADHVVSSVVVA